MSMKASSQNDHKEKEHGLWDDDFGQKVDLCRRIREILTNYPEGIAVLKEMVQNADDAGASTIRFVYDTRVHPTDNLAESGFSEFQSPSMLVYNNAIFTQSDFQSIQSIGSSISKKDDVNKTGRFGLGFNAVYHLTDVPAFVSADYLVYFDPQGKYLPNINQGNPGKRINFVQQKIIDKYPNQFYPFKLFDNDMIHSFKGTIFRLPLRTQKQSKESELSSKYYTDQDIKLMYKALITEGDNFLLFLKHITTLEWFEWKDIKQKQPTLCYSVNIMNPHKLNKKQIELRTYINAIKKASSVTWMQCTSFKFETYLHDDKNKNKKYESEWIICNAIGGGSNQASQIALSHPNMKLLPYGGIAARISSNVPWQNVFCGKAYCFLSLPIKSGLPVHVNGYFELSQNRRNLWWGGAQDEDKVSMTGDGSLRYFWNLCLLQDVITRCYVNMIYYAKQLCIHNKMDIKTFYKLWPYQIPGNKGDPFEILTREVLTIICESRRFLHSKQNGGSWLKCSESVMCNLDEFELQLYAILNDIGVPIVEIPKKVHYVLQNVSMPPVTLSSVYLREWIRKQITNNIDPNTNILANVNHLDSARKMVLNQYLLNDLIHLKSQQLSNKPDFPQCCHMLPILPTFSVLKTFWCNNQMDADIAQQIFGSNYQQYTQSVYYSPDKQLIEILSCTQNEQICSLLVNINLLSEPMIRILNHNKFTLNTNLMDITDNYPLITKLLNIIFQCQRKRSTFINNKRFHFQFVTKKEVYQIWRDLVHNIWEYIVRKQMDYKYYKTLPIVAAYNYQQDEHFLCLPSSSSWIIKPLSKTNKVSKEQQLVFELLTKHSPCVILDSTIINSEVARHILYKNRSIYSIESTDDVLRLLSVLPSTVFTDWCQNMDKLSTFLRALRHCLITSNIDWNTSSDNIQKLLKSLPIYDVYCDHDTDDKYTLTDLISSTKYIPPQETNIHSSLLSSQFIYITNEDKSHDYHRFLHSLHIQTMPMHTFYKRYFFNKLNSWNDDVRNSSIIQILQSIKRNEFAHDNDSHQLIEMIKATNCIPTNDNTLKRVSNLYDPTVKELQNILDINKHFPNPIFSKLLSILRDLGLNTQLNRDTILLSVTSIATSKAKATKEDELGAITKRAKALLLYLDNHWQQQYDATYYHQWNALKQYEWLPIITDCKSTLSQVSRNSHPLLPYKSTKDPKVRRFASCDEVRAVSLASLCSSQFYILDIVLQNESLQNVLGLNQIPSAPHIAKQLVEIANVYQDLSKTSQQRASFQEWLASNIQYIYRTIFYQLFNTENSKTMKENDPNANSFLSSAFNFINKTKTMFDDERKEKEKERKHSLAEMKIKHKQDVKNTLEQNKWIWINGSFYDSDRVALHHTSQDSINCRPYLEIIPSSYNSLQALFIECSVRNKFEPRDYANILNLIHKDPHKQDIHLAVQISQYVSDHMNVMSDLLFPIPTNDGNMDYANHLYYNDAPWIHHRNPQQEESKKESVHFVHNKLSIDVAKKLGANSFRELFVSTNSESMAFEFNSLSFGQHESLTRRLKDILRAYPAGPSIINEFIQNADDAGATKVIIMLNERDYGTDCLLSNKLKPFQGPSLLVYNDSTFDETDFINLSRIGQGSKLQKLEATGRFGLGFNCCYHITDVPQLVSASSIVLFDPHASHLPNVNSNAPGIRINFMRSDLVHTFPDQFAPFQDFKDIFNCSLDEIYDGTLFRFPLRNANVAKYSEIKSDITSIQHIKKMLVSFSTFAKETLLFLRSVCCIKVMIAHANGAVDEILNVEINKKQKQTPSIWSKFIKKGSKSTHAFYRYLQRLNEKENALPKGIRSIQIISATPNEQSTDEFVICEQIGGGDTVAIACKEENRDLKLIPFGCVAAHISSSSSSIASTSKCGRAFTFLPLPIKTGLPVHLNSYFELSANRRDLWWGLDLEHDVDSNDGAYTVKHKWNQSLLRYVLAPCYCHLIQYIATTKVNECNEIQQYYDLFPHKVDSQPFMELLQSFYAKISNLNVLYYKPNDADDAIWLSPSKCIAFPTVITDLEDDINGQQDDCTHQMQAILLKCNQSVVSLDQYLMDSLIKYKSGLHQFDSMWLRTKFLSSFGASGFPISVTYDERIFLLKICLQDINANNIQQLYNLPLLPLNNGSFVKILSHKVALNQRVFFTRDESFIHLLKTAPNANVKDNNISNRVIASSDLPNSVVSKLSDKDILQFTNICEPNHDVLIELLPYLLPCNCSTRKEILWDEKCPTKEWLKELWIALQNLRDPMKDLSKLCVVPVLSYVSNAQCYKSQKKLVTCNITQHVYIDVRSLDEPLKQLLFELGFHCIHNEYIVNHPSLSKYILKPTLIGMLQGFDKLIHIHFNGNRNIFCSKRFNTKRTKNQRIALRQFMVRQMDNIQYEDNESQQILTQQLADFKPLMKTLPIYQVFCNQKKNDDQKENQEESFVSLSSNDTELIWPPSDVNIASFILDNFSISFVNVEGNGHNYCKLLQFLDMAPLSKSTFYDSYILPKMEEYSPNTRDAVILSLLRNLQSLQDTDPSFVSKLLKHPFLPTGPKSKLCHISKVYVPEPKLRRFLDEDVMPSASFCSPDIIQILSAIGLKTEMDLEGIMLSAKSITNKLQKQWKDGMLFAAKQRARALLKYLDENWLQLKENHFKSKVEEAEKKWNEFIHVLKHTQWINIHHESAHPALIWKWSNRKDDNKDINMHFATPLSIRCKSVSWMVSASHPTMAIDLKSKEFIHDLSWDSPLTHKVVATQLKQQAEHINRLKERNLFEPQWEQELIKQNKAYYTSLNAMLHNSESEDMNNNKDIINDINAILHQAPVLFISASIGYLPIHRVSWRSDCGASPFLVTLSDDEWNTNLKEFPYLFQHCLQIKQQFEIMDYVRVLHQLYTNYHRKPLNEHDLNVGIEILEYLGNYDEMSCNETPQNEEQNETTDGNNSENEQENEENSNESKNDIDIIDTTPIYIRYGPIYIPNMDGIMYESTKMVFNDALFLDESSFTNTNVVFVHSKITGSVARKLGVKSFRDVFTSSNKTPSEKYKCSGAYLIKKKLQEDKLGEIKKNDASTDKNEEKNQAQNDEKSEEKNDNPEIEASINEETLLSNIALSVFEIADILESRTFEIIVDPNEYGTHSVLNERMAALQGASLLFRFDKCITIQQILKLQQILPWNINCAVPDILPQKSLHFQSSGLLPLYHLTDCIQIISREHYVILDPADQYLQEVKQQNKPYLIQQFAQKTVKCIKNVKSKPDNITFKWIDNMISDNTEMELMTMTGSVRIFTYIHNKSTTKSDKALIKQFPDQFAPFTCFKVNDNKAFPGTIIRIPLRTNNEIMSFHSLLKNIQDEDGDTALLPRLSFPLSSYVCDLKTLNEIPLFIKDKITNCLIFATNVENIAISTVTKHGKGKNVLYESRVANLTDSQRALRDKVHNATTWKQKYSMSRLFGGYKPKTYQHKLQITTRDYTQNVLQITDNYAIFSNMGDGNARNLAVQHNEKMEQPKHNGQELHYRIPFCSVAIKISGNIIRGRNVVHKYNGLKKLEDETGYLFVNGIPAIATNLPIHLNAMFILNNQCRLELFNAKLLSTDVIHWNNELYRSGIASAYIEALSTLAQNHNNKRNVIHSKLYELWPSEWNRIPLQLRTLQRAFNVKASKAPLFLSAKKEFVTMNESYFASNCMSLLAAKFISKHCDVFSVPGYILEQLKINTGNVKNQFSPKDFRSLLHKKKSSLRSDLRNINNIELVFDLLQFFLSDLKLDSTERTKLRGICLLPLASRKIVKYGISAHGAGPYRPYVVASCNQQLMLPHFKQFVHPKCCECPLDAFFTSKLFCKSLGLKLWNLEFARNELNYLFKFKHIPFVKWEYEEKENPVFDDEEEEEGKKSSASDIIIPHRLSDGLPHPKWIKLFWLNVPIADQSKGTIKFFGALPLIPLTNNHLCFVQFASKIALTTIEEGDNAQDPYLVKFHAILTEMKYPIIDWRFFPNKDCDQLIGKLSNINVLTKTVLSNVNTLSPYIKPSIDNETNKVNLIEICAEALKKGTHFSDKMIDNLKSLAVFENGDGQFIACTDSQKNYMMMFDEANAAATHQKLPARFLEYILTYCNCVVLKYKYPELHRKLGIEEMKEDILIEKFLDSYMNFLQAAMNDANEGDSIQPISEMIEYLVNCYDSNSHLQSLLCNTPLIPSRNETLLLSTKNMYDPTVPIFAKLFADEAVFPHSMMLQNRKYMQWMISMGMNHDINGCVFVKCAKKLESLSGVLTSTQLEAYHEQKQDVATQAKYPAIQNKDIISLSVELTVLLSKHFNEIFSQNVFDELSNIAFLPCVIPSLESNKNDDNNDNISICRPSECLLQKDYHYAWTVAPVLNTKMPEMGLQHLKIETPPNVDIVMKHCVNLSQIRGGIDNGWIFKDDPLTVFDKIIFYFNSQFKAEKLSNKHIELLRNIAFIPIGSRLLKASHLFMTMDGGDLSPFMFMVPRQFQSYEALFKLLGTKEKPSIRDYHRFLTELYSYNKSLNINELNAVFKVIDIICKQMDAEKHKVEKLLVPSESGVLIWSNSCVYNDDTYLASRVNRNENSNTRLTFSLVHSGLKLSLCSQLNILPLSKAVIENIDVYKEIKLQQNHNPIIEYIYKNMDLCANIERIVRHHILNTDTKLNRYKVYNLLNLPSKELIYKKIQKLKIIFCKDLNTKLTFKQLEISFFRANHQKSKSKSNVKFFFDKRRCVLYLLWPLSNSMYYSTILSNCICNILDIYYPEMITALSSVLYIPNIDNMKKSSTIAKDNDLLLDIMGISGMDLTQNGMLRGISGAKITTDDEPFLQKQPLRKFLEDEIVAIENPQQKTTKKDLIYANVVSVQQDSFAVLSKLKLKYNQSGSTVIVSSNNVYSFKSNLLDTNIDNESHNNNNNNKNDGDDKNKLLAANRNNNIESKENDDADENDNNDDDIDELIETVHNMMDRAGLNINKDKAEMMRENLLYRKNLENIRKSNNALKHENNSLTTEIENATMALTCRICQENAVNRVLPNCGHLLCSSCLPLVRYQKCPFCRKEFNQSVQFINPLTRYITNKNLNQ